VSDRRPLPPKSRRNEDIRCAKELIRREHGVVSAHAPERISPTELLVPNADLARQRARTGQGTIGPRPGRGVSHSLREVAVQTEVRTPASGSAFRDEAGVNTSSRCAARSCIAPPPGRGRCRAASPIVVVD